MLCLLPSIPSSLNHSIADIFVFRTCIVPTDNRTRNITSAQINTRADGDLNPQLACAYVMRLLSRSKRSNGHLCSTTPTDTIYITMNTLIYRFRIIAGSQYGQTFSVDEKGVIIGRSENCDIVITDPSLSRHHCRIFVRDGLLWVGDLKSANGTAVDGLSIEEAPIWKDRRVTIGDTVILVENDGGVKHPESTRKKLPLPFPLTATLAASILLLALYAAYFFTGSSAPQSPVPGQPATSPATAYIGLDYYRMHTDTNTIYTFHFQVFPPDAASIRIADLAMNREMRRSVTIPPHQIELLSQTIADADFFSLSSAPDMTGTPSEVRISAHVNGRQHTVRNPIDGGSATFRNLTEELEGMAAILFGSWIHDFSDEALNFLAERIYTDALAMGDISNRNRHDVLHAVIQDLVYAEWLLHPILPEPELLTNIRSTQTRYREHLDAHIRDIFIEADLAARRQDYVTEGEVLELLLARLPDEQDPRYRTARQRLQALPEEGDLRHAQ